MIGQQHDGRFYAAEVTDRPEESWLALPSPMQRALALAWESVRAGSLGIGAVATDGAGEELSTGRNRLLEHEPGDDVLAGSSLAHAELNVLAKLRFQQHESDEVQLYTTLQPCVQCLGAIRLSPVRRVHVLAPDPLFRGLERMRDLSEFIGRSWPDVDYLTIDEWSVLSLLWPTHFYAFWDRPLEGWSDRLPMMTALASRLVDENTMVEAALQHDDVVTVARHLWPELGECVVEVAELALEEQQAR